MRWASLYLCFCVISLADHKEERRFECHQEEYTVLQDALGTLKGNKTIPLPGARTRFLSLLIQAPKNCITQQDREAIRIALEHFNRLPCQTKRIRKTSLGEKPKIVLVADCKECQTKRNPILEKARRGKVYLGYGLDDRNSQGYYANHLKPMHEEFPVSFNQLVQGYRKIHAVSKIGYKAKHADRVSALTETLNALETSPSVRKAFLKISPHLRGEDKKLGAAIRSLFFSYLNRQQFGKALITHQRTLVYSNAWPTLSYKLLSYLMNEVRAPAHSLGRYAPPMDLAKKHLANPMNKKLQRQYETAFEIQWHIPEMVLRAGEIFCQVLKKPLDTYLIVNPKILPSLRKSLRDMLNRSGAKNIVIETKE